MDYKARDGGPVECPKCETLNCGHTTQQRQLFYTYTLTELTDSLGLYDLPPIEGEIDV